MQLHYLVTESLYLFTEVMSSEDSSCEEDTEKLKEATWSFGPAKTNGSQTGHSNGNKGKEEKEKLNY